MQAPGDVLPAACNHPSFTVLDDRGVRLCVARQLRARLGLVRGSLVMGRCVASWKIGVRDDACSVYEILRHGSHT